MVVGGEDSQVNVWGVEGIQAHLLSTHQLDDQLVVGIHYQPDALFVASYDSNLLYYYHPSTS